MADQTKSIYFGRRDQRLATARRMKRVAKSAAVAGDTVRQMKAEQLVTRYASAAKKCNRLGVLETRFRKRVSK